MTYSADHMRTTALEKALADLLAAIDAPRYGDDSIWDDLMGLDDDGGPLGRARVLLAQGTETQSATTAGRGPKDDGPVTK